MSEVVPIRVDVSGMKVWRDCQLKHFFSYHRGLQSAGSASPDSPFIFGSIGHDALESWYAPNTFHNNQAALQAAIASWQRYGNADFFKSERLAKWQELLEDVCVCLSDYFDHFKDEKVRPISTEMPFDIPILEGKIRLYGKVDSVIEYRGENQVEDLIYFIEDKFYKTIPSDTNYLSWNSQVSTYFLIGRMMYGKRFGGILYNIIRKKKPVRASDAPLYYREELHRSDNQLRSALKFIAVQAMQMQTVYAKGDLYLVPVLDDSPLWNNVCKRCEFNNDLCRAYREGQDWQAIAEAAYQERNLHYAESDE